MFFVKKRWAFPILKGTQPQPGVSKQLAALVEPYCMHFDVKTGFQLTAAAHSYTDVAFLHPKKCFYT